LGSGLAALLAEFNPWRIVWDTWDGLLQWLFGIDLGELAAHWIETLREGFREALADLKAWLQDRIRDVVGFLPDWLQEKLGFTPGGEADGSTDERAAPDSEPDAQGQPVRVPSRFEGRQPYAAIPTPIDTAAMLDALKPVPAGGPAPAGAGGLKPFPMGPTTQNVDNSTVVSVTVPPGSDVSAIAAAVARELERRQRGALHDLD
jgi:hypothetical protein